MDNLKLYRRRFIPDETVLLKDDIIVCLNNEEIVTTWKVLKPRKDFSHGISLYLPNSNYKISKFFNIQNECIYIYCDIIETIYNKDDNSILFNDLLADVKIYDDGKIEVLDLSEIPDALEQNLITQKQANISLRALDNLLYEIYNNQMQSYIDKIDSHVKFV